MKYVLQPTQDDVLHYAKGTESKAHKYISRAFKKGRWVYTYAKDTATGNAVTNKNGKKAGESNKMQYSPTVKTYANGDVREPLNPGVYLRDTRTSETVNGQYQNDPKISNVDKSHIDPTVVDKLKKLNAGEKKGNEGTAYSPNVLSEVIGRDINGKHVSVALENAIDKYGNKYLAEFRNTANKKALEAVNRAHHIEEKRYTNKGQPEVQYSPAQSTKAASSRHYTPNEKKKFRPSKSSIKKA